MMPPPMGPNHMNYGPGGKMPPNNMSGPMGNYPPYNSQYQQGEKYFLPDFTITRLNMYSRGVDGDR